MRWPCALARCIESLDFIARPSEIPMPYLQLDVNGRHAVESKRELARRMANTYASLMSVDIRRISIAIRDLDDGSVWRTVDGEPVEVSVLMCDIRKGRSAEKRLEVAKALCQDCIDVLGLRQDRLNVEFTQHSGDEMYHPTLGGFSPEWTEGEDAPLHQSPS